MKDKITGFAASGLTHPDYGDTVGERLRLQSAITTSLLEFMALTFEHDNPQHIRLLWDLLYVAAERANALTSALNGVEIALPPGQQLAARAGKGKNDA